MHKVISHIDKNTKATSLCRIINVLQIHWLSEALKNVRSSTVTKCFMKGEFASSHEPEDNPDDHMPLADLIRLLKGHPSETITIPHEYALIDNDILVMEELNDHW